MTTFLGETALAPAIPAQVDPQQQFSRATRQANICADIDRLLLSNDAPWGLALPLHARVEGDRPIIGGAGEQHSSQAARFILAKGLDNSYSIMLQALGDETFGRPKSLQSNFGTDAHDEHYGVIGATIYPNDPNRAVVFGITAEGKERVFEGLQEASARNLTPDPENFMSRTLHYAMRKLGKPSSPENVAAQRAAAYSLDAELGLV